MELYQLTEPFVQSYHLTWSAFVPQVCTEGRLILVFTFDDLMRIKTWHFTISHYNELIPRSMLAVHVSQIKEHNWLTWFTWIQCSSCQWIRHFFIYGVNHRLILGSRIRHYESNCQLFNSVTVWMPFPVIFFGHVSQMFTSPICVVHINQALFMSLRIFLVHINHTNQILFMQTSQRVFTLYEILFFAQVYCYSYE